MASTECSTTVIDVPDKPIGKICAPGAKYVCPCGDETWESEWKSGKMTCRPDFLVTECFCEDAGAD